ncbi:MAG: hypothetical protein KAV87_66200 [Desulfobacteraceae bacterium]|nr:hypothetical protein [Desulfobacteraceae bacterium]
MNETKKLSPRSDEYVEVVRDILWNCQVIEEGLRRYLIASYEYIQKKMVGSLPFHFDQGDFDKDSFGTLVSKFEKLSDNSSLVSQLRMLTEHRNKCAHRGFLLKVRQWCDTDFIDSELERLIEIRSGSETCTSSVMKEYKRVKGLLKE